jgi:hypothetical protein
MNKEYDNSPQARFVKEALRKENPELSEEQLEQIWQKKLESVQRELGEGNCLACGS